MGHAQAVRHDVNDVFVARVCIRVDVDFEESVDKVLGMQPLEHAMGIESVNVEAAQHFPSAQTVDDFQ